MNTQFFKFRKAYLLGIIPLLSLCIETSARARPRWGTQSMGYDSTVSSRNGKGGADQKPSRNTRSVHENQKPDPDPKAHSSMLSANKGQTFKVALKTLDDSVTDLHSAADDGSQAQAEAALKTVESAFDQLKAQDPETAFKGM
jgi:hypothetical protein